MVLISTSSVLCFPSRFLKNSVITKILYLILYFFLPWEGFDLVSLSYTWNDSFPETFFFNLMFVLVIMVKIYMAVFNSEFISRVSVLFCWSMHLFLVVLYALAMLFYVSQKYSYMLMSSSLFFIVRVALNSRSFCFHMNSWLCCPIHFYCEEWC